MVHSYSWETLALKMIPFFSHPNKSHVDRIHGIYFLPTFDDDGWLWLKMGSDFKDHPLKTRWWFRIFFCFHPESLGKWSSLTSAYFPPPTRRAQKSPSSSWWFSQHGFVSTGSNTRQTSVQGAGEMLPSFFLGKVGVGRQQKNVLHARSSTARATEKWWLEDVCLSYSGFR